MAMIKKDYELIASAINNALRWDTNIIDVLADVFHARNPRFNKDGFVEGCLKDWEPKKKKELSGLIIDAVYELAHAGEESSEWMTEGAHVMLVGIDKHDSYLPLRVMSLDGDEDTDWIPLDQLGNVVRLP